MATSEETFAPLTERLSLACEPGHAFDVYARRMGEWWDPRYSPDPATYRGILVEERVGGTVAMLHEGAPPYPWGEVRRWEPGRCFAQSFTLALPGGAPTTVTVSFAVADRGCAVDFEHGGWDASNVHGRRKYGDWGHLLGRFARLAES